MNRRVTHHHTHRDVKKEVLWFIALYIIIGILHTFLIGDYNFFQELTFNIRHAFLTTFLWPIMYVFIIGPIVFLVTVPLIIACIYFARELANRVK